MYRSASTSRVSDDHYSYYTMSPSSKVPTALRALSQESAAELPIYEPLSDPAKKEKTRAKFAEKAVHIIPLVLLFCALTLWFLSNPDVDVKGNALGGGKMEGMQIDGDLDSHGTKHLPVELGDMEKGKVDNSRIKFPHNRF